MRLIVLITAVCLMMSALVAEEDPAAALKTLATEVAGVSKHAAAALKDKNADDQQKAYQEIDALVAKFETWEEAAHKAGWGDEKIEGEQKKAGWDELLKQAKALKAAGAGAAK